MSSVATCPLIFDGCPQAPRLEPFGGARVAGWGAGKALSRCREATMYQAHQTRRLIVSGRHWRVETSTGMATTTWLSVPQVNRQAPINGPAPFTCSWDHPLASMSARREIKRIWVKGPTRQVICLARPWRLYWGSFEFLDSTGSRVPRVSAIQLLLPNQIPVQNTSALSPLTSRTRCAIRESILNGKWPHSECGVGRVAE